jgi:hypothetical protein
MSQALGADVLGTCWNIRPCYGSGQWAKKLDFKIEATKARYHVCCNIPFHLVLPQCISCEHTFLPMLVWHYLFG